MIGDWATQPLGKMLGFPERKQEPLQELYVQMLARDHKDLERQLRARGAMPGVRPGLSTSIRTMRF